MSRAEPEKRERADVAVVGGGPAGSAVALRLARQGLHVVQLERRIIGSPGDDQFRSGEAALPSTLSELRCLDIGMDAAQWTLAQARRVRIRWPHGDVTVNRLPRGQSIRILDRRRFDVALWQAAAEAGVDTRCGWSVRRLLLEGDVVTGLLASGRCGETVAVDAPLVIDAGGRNAPSLLQFDLRRAESGDDFVVVVLFFDDVPDLAVDTWEVHFFGRATPAVMQGARLGEGLVRFGLGAYLASKQGSGLGPEAFFWWRLRGYPELEQRLRMGRIVRPLYARARLGYQAAHIARSGLLLVGDAAGYLNPILGDGILMALRSAGVAAEVAAGSFARGDFSASYLRRYQHRWRAERRSRLWITRALIAAHRRPALVDRLGHIPALRWLALNALTRP